MQRKRRGLDWIELDSPSSEEANHLSQTLLGTGKVLDHIVAVTSFSQRICTFSSSFSRESTSANKKLNPSVPSKVVANKPFPRGLRPETPPQLQCNIQCNLESSPVEVPQEQWDCDSDSRHGRTRTDVAVNMWPCPAAMKSLDGTGHLIVTISIQETFICNSRAIVIAIWTARWVHCGIKWMDGLRGRTNGNGVWLSDWLTDHLLVRCADCGNQFGLTCDDGEFQFRTWWGIGNGTWPKDHLPNQSTSFYCGKGIRNLPMLHCKAPKKMWAAIRTFLVVVLFTTIQRDFVWQF